MGRKKKGDTSPKRVRVSYTISPDLETKILEKAEEEGKPASVVVETALLSVFSLNKPTSKLLRREAG